METSFGGVPAIVWGGGGLAIYLKTILHAANRNVVAVVDRNPDVQVPFANVRRFVGEADLIPWLQKRVVSEYVLAIGGAHGSERLRLAFWLESFGLLPFTAIHRSAHVATCAKVAPGCTILAMSAVCEEVALGAQTIVNVKASIGHEGEIGAGVHVMPGATLAGSVVVHDGATIGSGATVLPRIRIGRGAVVGAGAVVTKDVGDNVTVVGVPARPRS